MKCWAIFAAALVASGLTGCLSDDPRYLKMENQFNYKEVEWATKSGTNTVKGTINVQSPDGKKDECDFAALSPDSAYNREMIKMTFGNVESATILQKDLPVRFKDEEVGEKRTVPRVRCGWSGQYGLRDVPDGIWYFTAMAGPRSWGSFFMRRIELRGNQVLEINLP